MRTSPTRTTLPDLFVFTMAFGTAYLAAVVMEHNPVTGRLVRAGAVAYIAASAFFGRSSQVIRIH
jgi:hypothetical protein